MENKESRRLRMERANKARKKREDLRNLPKSKSKRKPKFEEEFFE